MVIVGLTAIAAGKALKIWWFPLTRDCVVYIISIIIMVVVMYDGFVHWHEALLMTLCYGVYLFLMVKNQLLVSLFCSGEGRGKVAPSHTVAEEQAQINAVSELRKTIVKRKSSLSATANEMAKMGDRQHLIKDISQPSVIQVMPSSSNVTTATDTDTPANGLIEDIPTEELEEPASLCSDVINILSIPYKILFKFTVPDCTDERFQSLYLVSFGMSIIWIGILSFIMVDFASRAGCILNIPGIVMGILVISAGTSVPDALSSILVARNGQGDMAIANVLGSNVFNIFLGLGLPWLVKTLLDGKAVRLPEQSIFISTLLLLIYVVFFILMFRFNNWFLTPKLGVIFLFAQAVFVGWNIMSLGRD